ncbi:hypothetical protein [Methanosarcina acetivorans]|uniref:hypothetical protein n=1 Tax=Methanosarcina acetivorans TaxID=2214 RepID=UPI0012FF192B|nr:hypothetical protein [Methanosarcina acetivorans]
MGGENMDKRKKVSKRNYFRTKQVGKDNDKNLRKIPKKTFQKGVHIQVMSLNYWSVLKK